MSIVVLGSKPNIAPTMAGPRGVRVLAQGLSAQGPMISEDGSRATVDHGARQGGSKRGQERPTPGPYRLQDAGAAHRHALRAQRPDILAADTRVVERNLVALPDTRIVQQGPDIGERR